MNIFQNKKIVAVTALVLVLCGLLVYFTYTKTVRGDKVAVQVAIFPSDAETTANGKTITPGTHYLDVGTYDIKGSKVGFKDFTESVYINEGQDIIMVTLEPSSDEAKRWVEEHEEEYYRVFGLGQERAVAMGKQFNELNPIAKHLPHRTLIYTIGYMNDNSDPSGNSIILTVYAGEGYRQSALYKIRDWGYDPTDFNIVFKDYENPFPL